MSTTLDEVQKMIRETASLSEDQRARFLAVSGGLDEAKLLELKSTLEKTQAQEMQEMKKGLEVLTTAGAAYKEWQADKMRKDLKSQEDSSSQAEALSAEALLSKL